MSKTHVGDPLPEDVLVIVLDLTHPAAQQEAHVNVRPERSCTVARIVSGSVAHAGD